MKQSKKFFTIFSVFTIFLTLTSLTIPPADEPVRKIKIDELEAIINSKSDTLYVINFWATWCKPCVKELPYFEKINKQSEGKNIKVLLVSVDYPNHYDSRLVPFVQKNSLDSEVVLLDEKDPNDWMPRINKNWQGSIPATLMIYGPSNTKKFYEREFTYKELNTEVNNIIK